MAGGVLGRRYVLAAAMPNQPAPTTMTFGMTVAEGDTWMEMSAGAGAEAYNGGEQAVLNCMIYCVQRKGWRVCVGISRAGLVTEPGLSPPFHPPNLT